MCKSLRSLFVIGLLLTTLLLVQAKGYEVVILHPSGFDDSVVLDVADGQQVGYGYVSTDPDLKHALLWEGTAASVVDLHPVGFDSSEGWGICGGQQVGYGEGSSTNNENHALLWGGTSEKVVDLHRFLPTEYVSSHAYGIDSAGSIVGYAATVSGSTHAVLWKPCQFELAGDINKDCTVNNLDLALMASNWLVNCHLTPDDPACIPKTSEKVVFGRNVRVDDVGQPNIAQLAPSIAVDVNENIYIAWQDERNGSMDIYFAKSTNGGDSFGTSVRVDDSGTSSSDQEHPFMVVDKNGIIYVVWWDERNGNKDIYFAKSTNGGTSFQRNVRVDDTGSSTINQYRVSMALDNDGNIYVVWSDDRNGCRDIYFSKSTDGGESFGENVRVDDTGLPSDSIQAWPRICLDASKNIYVSWFDARNGNLYDIYFAKSTDGGNSFSKNIRVDDTGGTISKQWNPCMAIDTDGSLYLSWDDERNGNSDIYLAKSTNGGDSFGRNVRVDDTGSSESTQWHSYLAVDENKYVYVAWEDYRRGNRDVYFSRSVNGGNSFEPDVRVDDTGSSDSAQWYPSLAVDTKGNVYVSWIDGRNGDYDIYFARGR